MEVKGVRDVPVGVIVWSQVETAATLVCVGIPVCRPLWTRHLSKFFKSRSSAYERQEGPSGDNKNDGPAPIGMNTFGGGTMPGARDSSGGSPGRKKKSSKVSSRISSLWSITTTSQAPRAGTEHRREDHDDTKSDEINLTISEEQLKGPEVAETYHGPGVAMGFPGDVETGKAAKVGEALKRSWILGEGVNQAYIQGDQSKEEEENKEGIMASRTYEIKRS